MNRQSTSRASSQKAKPKVKKEGPWKKRLLYGALASSLTVTLLWIIAFSTNYWVYWVLPAKGLYRSQTNTYLEKQYVGMWKLCRVERNNDTNERKEVCRQMDFFPSAEELEKDSEMNQSVLNYRRSVTALGVIAILVMAIANTFTYYSILEPRYVFKRLAGCLQIGCAGCILVCVEIFEGMIDYEKRNLPRKYPPRTSHTFGFCFGLAWFCFVIFLVASVILFVYSRKRKDEIDSDRPVIIGRI